MKNLPEFDPHTSLGYGSSMLPLCHSATWLIAV